MQTSPPSKTSPRPSPTPEHPQRPDLAAPCLFNAPPIVRFAAKGIERSDFDRTPGRRQAIEERSTKRRAEEVAISSPGPGGEERCRDPKKQAPVKDLARRLSSGYSAAREVRKLSRASARVRAVFAVVQPLIVMLAAEDHDNREAALLALLNLAVRNER
ncbi:hypothetical protein GW17_00025646 [Ensete ventricosum]|nr:hypothetical protein GW17_00025646 [Ensete ventricosum]